MKIRVIIFTIILNIISMTIWAENFLVNYYHKGTIVYQQSVTEGSSITSFPNINLISCNDNLPYFKGWITEENKNNYLSQNTTCPTFITEEYTPTTNINLYAVFADNETESIEKWTKVTKASQLKDGDKIIITSQSSTKAMSKTLDNNHFVATNINTNEDKSEIYITDDVQILTLKSTDTINYFALFNGTEYICNTLQNNNTIGTTLTYNDQCMWQFIANNKDHLAYIINKNTSFAKSLYYNNNYFACHTDNQHNVNVYKLTYTTTTNYIVCNEPDANLYTITFHDGENTTQRNYSSNEPITQENTPTPTTTCENWQFIGWSTTKVTNSSTCPSLIQFPFTLSNDCNLYAIYTQTTETNLIMTNKTISAEWTVNETLCHDTYIALFKNNYITTPTINNISHIDIEMRNIRLTSSNDFYLILKTDIEGLNFTKTDGTTKLYTITFTSPTTTSLKFTSNSNTQNEGLYVKSITIHHSPTYTSDPICNEYATLSFDANGGKETKNAYKIKQIKGQPIQLPNTMFSHAQKDFIGWNSTLDGSATKYDDNGIIKNLSDNITLFAQWGTLKIIDTDETWSINTNTTIDKLKIKSINENSGKLTITNKAQLNVKDIIFEKKIDGSRYHFISLPFECKIADILAYNTNGKLLEYATLTSGDWVICQYDQTIAAKNAGDKTQNAWVELLDPETILEVNRGYIIGHFGNEDDFITLKFSSTSTQTISEPTTTTLSFNPNYQWYTDGASPSSNGWNLIGQPFYETLQQGTLTNYVTIPNSDGKTYTQMFYKDALTNQLITPFYSFFIQIKENLAPTFYIEASNQALLSNKKDQQISIYIGNDTHKDKTTIINNPLCTPEYEIENDLQKWIGFSDIPQIYTIENNIKLAFNSLEITKNTTIDLGVYAPIDGNYTFNSENYPSTYLLDTLNHTITNLAQTSYTTYLTQGEHNTRFKIHFTNNQTSETVIPYNISCYTKNGTIYIENMPIGSIAYIYDALGREIGTTTIGEYTIKLRGVYHIIIKQDEIKINNYTIIF